jgi:hypothetical protein
MRMVPLGLLLLLTGCAGKPGPGSTPSMDGRDMFEDVISAVISGALHGEAAGENTDSLFLPSALIIVDGRTPGLDSRFAAMGEGGEVAITSSQLEVRGSSSWSVVDYRWGTTAGTVREGRATFVLTQVEPGIWRIQHVHSSSPQ